MEKYSYLCGKFNVMGKETNPFVVKGEIAPQYFCDRVNETERMVKTIPNGNNLVLISSRRMGKTGLIEHCFRQPEFKDYYTFFIDILHTSSLREFTFMFGKEIFEKLLSKGKKMKKMLLQTLGSLRGGFGVDPMTGNPTFGLQLGDIASADYTLEEIFQCLEQADKPCIVAIDEFQQITNYPEKNVEALLRSYIQHTKNVSFIFAGSERHLMQEMFQTESRPFYYSAEMMELNAIKKDVYVPFIVQKFEEKHRKIDKNLVENVYDLFEGHTFYVQKTFNESFMNTPKKGICTAKIVSESIEMLLEIYSPFFKLTLSEMPEKQKELFYSIALDGTAEAITSAGFIDRHSLSSASSVQSAAKRLLDRDLITKEGKEYRLTDRLFSLWIKRLHGRTYLDL